MDYREILTESSLSIWEEVSNKLASNYQVKVIQAPETCLIMMPALDSAQQGSFFLGELLVTEAVVEINGHRGYGLAMEDSPENALTYAIIDAALTGKLPETEEINQLLTQAQEEIIRGIEQEKRMIASTRVKFTILEG